MDAPSDSYWEQCKLKLYWGIFFLSRLTLAKKIHVVEDYKLTHFLIRQCEPMKIILYIHYTQYVK